jgi:hypothetical protein
VRTCCRRGRRGAHEVEAEYGVEYAAVPADCGAVACRDIIGGIGPGEQLPSVGELAGELAVNPLTVARAMNELEAAGLIESRWGKGNFVRQMKAAQREVARGR